MGSRRWVVLVLVLVLVVATTRQSRSLMAAVRAFLFCFSLFLYSRCFPRAFVRETSMHRACRLTLFFRFNSHRDYSNRVPRVVSLALPKRGGTSPTLQSTILPSLRPNQFGIFLNRTFSPRDIRCLAISDSIDVRSTLRDVFRSSV